MDFRRFFVPIVRKFYYHLRFYLRPRTKDEAEEMREILSKLYMLSALGFFGAAAVYVGVNNIDFGDPSVEGVVERFKIDTPTRVIKFKGFTKVDDYILNPEKQTINVETKSSENSKL